MRRERAAENDVTETLGEAGATPPFDARCVTALWGRSRLADTCKRAGFFSGGPKFFLTFPGWMFLS